MIRKMKLTGGMSSMKKKLKGGIETIIAIVIIVGIVIALICVSVLPISKSSQQLTGTATSSLGKLQQTITTD